jgi:hypothetical protein
MPTADRSELFAGRAQQAALGVITPAIVRASQQAVSAVAAQTEAGYLAESAHDVAAMRADHRLIRGLSELVAQARKVVLDQAMAALSDGYRTTMDSEASRLGLRFTDGPEVAANLLGHPIVDATPTEWATFLAGRLEWRIRGIATRAALGAIKPAAIPAQTDAAGQAWAVEVARLAGDAWHAGRSAARAALARALSS